MKNRKPWVICTRCRGEGTIVHPACSVWTAEDRYNDPDGFDDMMNGVYDVTCHQCGGSGKVRKGAKPAREFDRDAIRLQALESGDSELYLNPELGMY